MFYTCVRKAKLLLFGVVRAAILKRRVYFRYETRSHLSPRINRFVLPLGTFMQKETFASETEVQSLFSSLNPATICFLTQIRKIVENVTRDCSANCELCYYVSLAIENSNCSGNVVMIDCLYDCSQENRLLRKGIVTFQLEI